MPQNSVLFITSRDFLSTSVLTGGLQLSKLNYLILKELTNIELFAVYPHHPSKVQNFFSKIFQLLNLFLGNNNFLTRKKRRLILQLAFPHDLIFIDYSLYGVLAKDIKKAHPQKRVITHFHNIEYEFTLGASPLPRALKHLLAFLVKKNEEAACKFSDDIIFLSDHDSVFYKDKIRAKTHVIPPAIIDKNNGIDTSIKERKGRPIDILFCGSNFKPNTDGLDWFVTNVMPSISCQLVVIGLGMETLRKKYQLNQDIKIIGTVPDVSLYYKNCDLVIAPIFDGSGIKIKSIEALMYNKPLIGTSNSLRGIPVDNNCVFKCETPESFVAALKNFADSGFKINNRPRIIFESLFSINARKEKLRKITLND